MEMYTLNADIQYVLCYNSIRSSVGAKPDQQHDQTHEVNVKHMLWKCIPWTLTYKTYYATIVFVVVFDFLRENVVVIGYPPEYCTHNHKQRTQRAKPWSTSAVAPLLLCTAVAARRVAAFEIELTCGFLSSRAAFKVFQKSNQLLRLFYCVRTYK